MAIGWLRAWLHRGAGAVVLLGCLLCAPAHATRLLWGGEPATGQVLVDADGQWDADAALKRFEAGEGQPFSDTRFYPLEGNTVVWLRLALPAGPGATVLSLPHPGLNRADLYQAAPPSTEQPFATQWQVQHSGDALPVADWALPHLHPAFVVHAPPGPATTVLLRVSHNHPITLPWRVESKAEFDASSQLLLLLLGAYLGFVLLVVCVSTFNWVVWRDRLHLTNAFYVLLTGLSQVSLTGVGGQFAWPHHAAWNNHSAVVLPLLGVVMAGWFTYRVVAERAVRAWRMALLGYCGIGLVLTAAIGLFGRDAMFAAVNLYFLLSGPVCILAMASYARRNPRAGWWFVAAFAVLLAGGLFAVLRNLGWLPMSPLTQFGAQIGAGLQVPLLLVGLYYRSREKRDNQVRMSALTRVDPLTGLSSHRVLLDRLGQLLHRGSPLAVLRVRVGNARALGDEYGLEAQQAALVHAGACIGRVAREGDTVARHRDGDFVLLLPSGPTREQVADVAQRIIARGLAHAEGLPGREVLRLLVAAAVPPHGWTDGEELLNALEGLVDELQSRPGGKALRYLD